jgi:excisionase family DNA binding protein
MAIFFRDQQATCQGEHVTMNDLEKILGEAITVKELAKYLGINQKTLRENSRQFGGIKIGRHYRFFTQEVAKYALEKRQENNWPIQKRQIEEREGLQNNERSKELGSPDAESVIRRTKQKDSHSLLD